MNRRGFLAALSALPFLGFLKPAVAVEPWVNKARFIHKDTIPAAQVLVERVRGYDKYDGYWWLRSTYLLAGEERHDLVAHTGHTEPDEPHWHIMEITADNTYMRAYREHYGLI